jgi:hypothetical protein
MTWVSFEALLLIQSDYYIVLVTFSPADKHTGMAISIEIVNSSSAILRGISHCRLSFKVPPLCQCYPRLRTVGCSQSPSSCHCCPRGLVYLASSWQDIPF